MRAARREAESDLAGSPSQYSATAAMRREPRMSELENVMQQLAKEIIAAPASLRACVLRRFGPLGSTSGGAFDHGAFEFRDDIPQLTG